MKKRLLALLAGMCMAINLFVPVMSIAEDIDEIPMPTPPVETALPTVTVAPDTGEEDFDEIPMPTPTPPVAIVTEPPVQYPEPFPYSWEVSSEYNGCPAGTELMVGLTTLFDNICDNGKYISGVDSGNWSKGVATGLAVRYAPTADGVLTVSFIQLGSQKSIVANIEGGEKNSPLAVVANDGLEKISGNISIEVEAGNIYYVYGAGTKARLTEAHFEEGAELEATPVPSPTAFPTPTPVPTATPEITATPDVTETPKPGEIIIATDESIIVIPLEPTDEPCCTSPGPDIATPEPTPDCEIPPICIEPENNAATAPTEVSSELPDETGSTSESLGAGSGSQADEIFPPYYLTIWESDENGFEIFARAEDISDVVVYAASYDGNGRLIELQSYEMKEANEMIRYDMPILKEGHVKVYMWRGITSLTEIEVIKIF